MLSSLQEVFYRSSEETEIQPASDAGSATLSPEPHQTHIHRLFQGAVEASPDKYFYMRPGTHASAQSSQPNTPNAHSYIRHVKTSDTQQRGILQDLGRVGTTSMQTMASTVMGPIA